MKRLSIIKKNNLIIGSGLILFTTLTFFACSKQDGDRTIEDPVFVNTFDIVGQIHNQGLVYVIEKFKSKGLVGKAIDDPAHAIFSLTVEFAKEIPAGSELSFHGSDFETHWGKTYPILVSLDSREDKAYSIPLSDQQLEFIHEFKRLLRNSRISDSVFVFREILGLESRIWQSSMTLDEKYQLLLGTAVGKYSWVFWTQYDFPHTSVHAGLKEINNPIDPENPFDWNDFINTLFEADHDAAIVGAIAGCIGGAIYGTVLMPGVGSLTACVLESVRGATIGAIFGSSYAAIKYLYSHFFDPV